MWEELSFIQTTLPLLSEQNDFPLGKTESLYTGY